uniref:C2H2-type domain-containing protein n=1 Tax=Timema cristinae TaxID=61476 RepID=A0A7R9CJK1_TIMCR|nr:unnamed protein product [Timema cristinae]
MNHVENQALELLRRRDWSRAAELFDQLLGPALGNDVSQEKLITLLLGRSECCSELGHHDVVVSDCRRIIKLHGVGNHGGRARRRLVHALFSMRRFAEAEAAAREWLITGGGPSNQPEAVKMLERLRIVLQMANGHDPVNTEQKPHEYMGVTPRLEHWTGGIINEQSMRPRKHPVELIRDMHNGEPAPRRVPTKLPGEIMNRMDPESDPRIPNFHSQIEHVPMLRNSEDNPSLVVEDDLEISGDGSLPVCSYCCLTFSERAELRAHCQSQAHQTVIMSDEGRDWKWRPPPRGLTADHYTLCESWADSCRYGAQCVEAHGAEELAEWRERFEYRRMKMQRACEKELFGKSYTEQLLERWVQAPSPEKVMREKLSCVDETCSDDLVTTVSSKVSHKDWVFVLKTNLALRVVALLQDAHRNHFTLRYVSSSHPARQVFSEWTPTNDQEWSLPPVTGLELQADHDTPLQLEHRVKVGFATDIYGTFRQSVVFDLGEEPVLVRHLCVDVVPVTDADRMREIRKGLVLSSVERWDATNADIIPFSSAVTPLVSTPEAVAKDSERERDLLSAYPSPRADTFTLTQCTVTERKLTRNNYRARMHELLGVEEMARYEQVARYNLTARLRLADCYLLAPSGMATSTAKYAHSGELFALMNLGKDVSEDTSAGRLILNNCTTVLMAATTPSDDTALSLRSQKRSALGLDGEEGTNPRGVVFEALIEDKGKTMIYLRLSAATVNGLQLKPETDFSAEVQFQLNRIPYCEWHYAIDKIADFRVIFPDTYLEPSIPWTPQRQWSEIQDSRLNLKQKEAVVAITTPVNCSLPPILIIGPFGTGKTYTLAQAIKQLLLQPDTRVLVCTHSNSAADLYIKDYLHPYVEAGHSEARPLRIYYHKRWVATVNHLVQKYCLVDLIGGVKTFRVPTLEDVLKHRVIVVTLSISMYLSTLGLPKGHFSHILLDEAAQAMECEAIMPLALANEDTRIVLAGDHMQLSPELFSQFAKERNLHVSLLERLYDHYPTTFPCKILLCENYRAHEAIIQFTSELFYDQKLISSGKQPRHDKFYPLTFFTTRGEDVQDINSTAFYNNSEVYEVVERVCELRKRWPPAWGKMDDQSIGIMTPYADQVFRIRSELRKRRMGGISVERVLNVQGKQFRAIFLSTVRTRRTCHSGTKPAPGGDEMDYGFLSNSKLLNTAITRAQSLVAVVGDPVALCSIGRCSEAVVMNLSEPLLNQGYAIHTDNWYSSPTLFRLLLDNKTYALGTVRKHRKNMPAAVVSKKLTAGEMVLGRCVYHVTWQDSAWVLCVSCNMAGWCFVVRKVWERFIEICNQNKSLFGITWSYLRSQLDGVELKKTYVLNPLAPEFVPRQFAGEPYIRLPSLLGPYGGVGPMLTAPYRFQVPPLPPYPCPMPFFYLPGPPPPPPPSASLYLRTPLFPPPPPGGAGPWALNYPLTSPPGRSTPVGWQANAVALAAVLKKKQEESARFPPGLGPSERKPALFAPAPQRPVPLGNDRDSYVPGGVISPASFPPHLNTTFNSYLDKVVLPHDPMGGKRGVGAGLDKAEQIQFLHNVHFPEKQALPPLPGHVLVNGHGPPLPHGDWCTLLPPNVSLGEMLESQPRQLEWYTHLMDTAGIEAATSFMELLNLGNMEGPRKTSSPPPALPDVHLNRLNILPQALEEVQPVWHDNSPREIASTKPLILRELEASIMMASGRVPENHAAFSPPPRTVEGWPARSGPLYQRQPPPPDNNPTPVHPLLDKPSVAGGSSGAFAGYARAAVSSLHQHDSAVFYPQPYLQEPQWRRQENGGEEESGESAPGGATYASVVRAQKPALSTSLSDPGEERSGDPFTVLRALGSKGAAQGAPGLYHYFS